MILLIFRIISLYPVLFKLMQIFQYSFTLHTIDVFQNTAVSGGNEILRAKKWGKGTQCCLQIFQIIINVEEVFLVWCVCVSVICVFSVFRILNKTSTEASIPPGIDQLHSTNNWQGTLQVYRGWNKQSYYCSKQSVCFTSLNKYAVARLILLRSKKCTFPLFRKIWSLSMRNY